MPGPYPWENPRTASVANEPVNVRDAHAHRCQRIWARVRGYQGQAERSEQEFEQVSQAITEEFGATGEMHPLAEQAAGCVAEASRLFAQAKTLLAIADKNLETVMNQL